MPTKNHCHRKIVVLEICHVAATVCTRDIKSVISRGDGLKQFGVERLRKGFFKYLNFVAEVGDGLVAFE